MIFSDENNIAKLAFVCEEIAPIDCDTVLRPYLFFEKSPAQVFSCGFWKMFKNLFFTEHLWATASRFFNSFYCFLPPGELIETSFFYFWTCFITAFERDEYHELKQYKVAAAWEHTFLGDITWNLAVYCRLISSSICISAYEFLCSTGLHYSPMKHLNVILNLKWNLRKQLHWGAL